MDHYNDNFKTSWQGAILDRMSCGTHAGPLPVPTQESTGPVFFNHNNAFEDGWIGYGASLVETSRGQVGMLFDEASTSDKTYFGTNNLRPPTSQSIPQIAGFHASQSSGPGTYYTPSDQYRPQPDHSEQPTINAGIAHRGSWFPTMTQPPHPRPLSSSMVFQSMVWKGYYTPVNVQQSQPNPRQGTSWLLLEPKIFEQAVSTPLRNYQKTQFRRIALEKTIAQNQVALAEIKQQRFLNEARMAQIQNELDERHLEREHEERGTLGDVDLRAVKTEVDSSEEFELMLATSGLTMAQKVKLLTHVRMLRAEVQRREALMGECEHRINHNDEQIAVLERQLDGLECVEIRERRERRQKRTRDRVVKAEKSSSPGLDVTSAKPRQARSSRGRKPYVYKPKPSRL